MAVIACHPLDTLLALLLHFHIKAKVEGNQVRPASHRPLPSKHHSVLIPTLQTSRGSSFRKV